MFGDGSLTLTEYAMREPVPLARIHDEVLASLRNRADAVVFGAQAVNAYVDEARMTQAVDILSTHARELAEELRAHLAATLAMAVRVREVAGGRGFRVYQLREPKNRHLADIRQVEELPPTRLVSEILVPTPEELVARKVMSRVARRGQPKGATDWRDVMVLLLAHPELKTRSGPVLDRLTAASADTATLSEWNRIVETEIRASAEDEEFEG